MAQRSETARAALWILLRLQSQTGSGRGLSRAASSIFASSRRASNPCWSLRFTAVAIAEVASKQFVGFDGAPAGDGDAILGVAQTDAATGTAYAVDVIGVFDLVAGAAIPAGSEVQSDANGKPIVKAAGAHDGTALTAAANPGDIVKILIK